MRKYTITLLALALVLALLTGCSAIAPREKTIILSEEIVVAGEETNDPAQQSFEVKKITKLPLEKLDPTGNHPGMDHAVIGWIDEDNLAAMSVQTVQVEPEAEEEAAEEAAPETHVMTQFVRIHSQYGFFDPILTLQDVAAECYDISADGMLAAFVEGNRLDVYSLGSGTLVQTLQRQVLASRVTFAQTGHTLYFTEAGDEKLLEKFNADNGVASGVLSGKSYRVLDANDHGMVVCTQADGSQVLGYYDGQNFQDELLDKKARAGSCGVLPGGEGLVVYGGDLYLLNADGVKLAGDSVTAFDIAPDGMHIAFSRRNDDGTVDILVGYWSGSRIINEKLTYKDLGIEVNAMYFSPNQDRLYLQGLDETGALTAYTFEFR